MTKIVLKSEIYIFKQMMKSFSIKEYNH